MSESADVTRVAVTRWDTLVNEFGVEVLRSAKQPGRPTKLLDEQASQINTVLQMVPRDLWYDVQLSECQRLFYNLGYPLIRLQSFSNEGTGDTTEHGDVKKYSK